MPSADFAAMPPPVPIPICAQPAIASAAPARAKLSLADDIAHLAFLVDGPRLDAVMVLHEAGDGARLLDLRHRRLHIAGAVDRAAHQHARSAVPVPAGLEARKALVHDRVFQRRLAPALAAAGRDVDRADLAVARPA